MKSFSELIAALIFGSAWLAGIVLATGFWGTMASIFIPFYAWYLVIKLAMQIAGWIV